MRKTTTATIKVAPVKKAAVVAPSKNTYKHVSKNICKQGPSYRVRVCGVSCMCKTQKEAFAKRKELKAINAK